MSFNGLLANLFAFLLWKRCRARSSAFRAPKLSASYSRRVFALLFGCRGSILDLSGRDVRN